MGDKQPDDSELLKPHEKKKQKSDGNNHKGNTAVDSSGNDAKTGEKGATETIREYSYKFKNLLNSNDPKDKSKSEEKPKPNEKRSPTLKELLTPSNKNEERPSPGLETHGAEKSRKTSKDSPKDEEKDNAKSENKPRPFILWDWLSSSETLEDHTKNERMEKKSSISGQSSMPDLTMDNDVIGKEVHTRTSSSETKMFDKVKQALHWPFLGHTESAENHQKKEATHEESSEIQNGKSEMLSSDGSHSNSFEDKKDSLPKSEKHSETEKTERTVSPETETSGKVEHVWHWPFTKRIDSVDSVNKDTKESSKSDQKETAEDNGKDKSGMLDIEKAKKRVRRTFDAFGAITEVPEDEENVEDQKNKEDVKSDDKTSEEKNSEIRDTKDKMNAPVDSKKKDEKGKQLDTKEDETDETDHRAQWWFFTEHPEYERQRKKKPKSEISTKPDSDENEHASKKEHPGKLEWLTPGFLKKSESKEKDKQTDTDEHEKEKRETTGKHRWFSPERFKSTTSADTENKDKLEGKENHKDQHEGTVLRDKPWNWFKKDENTKKEQHDTAPEKDISVLEKETPSAQDREKQKENIADEKTSRFSNSLNPNISDELTKESDKKKVPLGDAKSSGFNEGTKSEKPKESQAKDKPATSLHPKVEEDTEYEGVFNAPKDDKTDKVKSYTLDSDRHRHRHHEDNNTKAEKQAQDIASLAEEDPSDPTWWAADLKQMKRKLASSDDSKSKEPSTGVKTKKSNRNTSQRKDKLQKPHLETPKAPSTLTTPKKQTKENTPKKDDSNNKKEEATLSGQRQADEEKKESHDLKDEPSEQNDKTASENELSRENVNEDPPSHNEHSEDPFRMWSQTQDHTPPRTRFGEFRYPETMQGRHYRTSSRGTERVEGDGYVTGYSMQYPDPLGIKPPGTRNAFDEEESAQDPFLMWKGPPFQYKKQADKPSPGMKILVTKLRNVLNSKKE